MSRAWEDFVAVSGVFYRQKNALTDFAFCRSVFLYSYKRFVGQSQLSDQSIIIKIASPSSITPVSRKPAL